MSHWMLMMLPMHGDVKTPTRVNEPPRRMRCMKCCRIAPAKMAFARDANQGECNSTRNNLAGRSVPCGYNLTEDKMKAIYFHALLATTLVFVAACGDSDRTSTTTGLTSTSGEPSISTSLASSGENRGIGFDGSAHGFPTGFVLLTGGGTFDAATATNTIPHETRVEINGGFRCTATVAQGPLTGCLAGEGIRWDTEQLLASNTFKCSATDIARQASTNARTAVLLANFYRLRDGDNQSFRGQMIVSQTDLAPDIPGEQHLWIQGVGCGEAAVFFGSKL